MNEKLSHWDYFTQLSQLGENQLACAKYLLEYMRSSERTFTEEQLLDSAQDAMRKIILQKKLDLFPADKKKWCPLLAKNLFIGQLLLLRIPRLCKIYSVEHLPEDFTDLGHKTLRLCQKTHEYITPKCARLRFSADLADQMFDDCLAGILHCKSFTSSLTNDHYSRVEALLFKDLTDEFSSFFSYSMQFTHFSLLFPL